MNVALLISGQARFWKNFRVTDYSKDVNLYIFFHSWSYTNPDSIKRNSCYSVLNPGFRGYHTDYSASNELVEFLKPQSHEISDFEKMEPFFRSDSRKFVNIEGPCRYSVLPMLYSIWRVYELASTFSEKHNIQFDLMVRTRFDVRLKQPLDYTKFTENNKVYIPDSNHYVGLNDNFGVASHGIIGVYSGIYKYLMERSSEECRTIQLNPELILKKFLRKFEIHPVLCNIEYTLER